MKDRLNLFCAARVLEALNLIPSFYDVFIKVHLSSEISIISLLYALSAQECIFDCATNKSFQSFFELHSLIRRIY